MKRQFLKLLFLVALFVLAFMQLPATGQTLAGRPKSLRTNGRSISNVPDNALRTERASRTVAVSQNNGVMDLNALIAATAQEQQIPPRLWFSLIYQESGFKLRATSSKGARCYTQLMPDTARRFGLRVNAQLGIDDRDNPLLCLRAGAKYLRLLLDLFKGHVPLALAGYNAGEGAVIKYGYTIPPYAETRNYVERILQFTYGRAGLSLGYRYGAQQNYNAWHANLAMLPVPQTRPKTLSPFFQTVVLNPMTGGETDSQAATNNSHLEVKTKLTRVAPTSVIQPRLPTSSVYFRVTQQ